MVFIPLSTVALGTMRKDQVGNANGIFNFLRNMGGALGFLRGTVAQRHLRTDRSETVRWLSGANWILRRQLNILIQLMHRHGGPRVSFLRAMSLTQTALNRESQLWAYVDDFRYLVLICLACVPLAFLLKRPSPGAKGAA